MSQRYDIENMLADIRTILVANLNTAIDAVEAEKVAMGLPATALAHVDTTYGYFEQNWSDTIRNFSPVIFYGIEDVQVVGLGPASSQQYKIFVEAVFVDSGMDKLGKNRVHRYTRAIKDVLEQNFDRIPSASKTKIETVVPVSFKLDLNSSEEMRSGGVAITTSLA